MQAGCAVFQVVHPYRLNKHCDFVYNYRSSLKMHIKTQHEYAGRLAGCAVFQVVHPYRLNKQEQLQFVSTPFLVLTNIFTKLTL